jgi:hypothetical protein
MRTHGFVGWLSIIALPVCLSAVAGCEGDDPEAASGTPDTGTPDTGDQEAGDQDAGDTCAIDEGIVVADNASCTAAADDYTPRDQGSANDTWQACISDDNAYHRFDESISSIARIGAFERIADLLAFDGSRAPTAQDFVDARLAYVEDQGLESRISRREDEHYPAAPSACRDLTADEQAQYPDRCVGPVKIVPMLNDAFQQGATGADPVLHAARVEAALLWFLYVSAYKESTTCKDTVADCDSGYAYYTGGEDRSGGLGLSRYVKARSPQAHDRIWDGILAVRCWRDLDNPTGTASNTAMQELALAQLDRALLRGVALIVRQRLDHITCTAAWETVRILGPVLDHAATALDAANAEVLREQVGKATADQVDVDAAQTALDTIFPCP